MPKKSTPAATAVLDEPSISSSNADDMASAGLDAGSDAASGDAASGDVNVASESQTEVVTPPSWRDLAKEHGLDLSTHEDDSAAWKHLAEQVQSVETARREADAAKQWAQYGQEVVPYASEFRDFLTQKQAQQQRQPADPYRRPEYDPRWETMVTYDDGGAIVPVPKNGGTAEIAAKVQAHLNWQRGFIREPEKYLESFVDQRAEQRLAPLLRAELESFQAKIAAEQFVTNNPWLWEKDANGEHVYAPDQYGRPVKKLSEEGQFYSSKLNEAQSAGFSSQQQEFYANQMLTERRRHAATTKGAAKSAADVKQDFLKAAASHGAQPAASTVPPLRTADPPQNSNQSYTDRLRAAFQQSGIDDKTFAA